MLGNNKRILYLFTAVLIVPVSFLLIGYGQISTRASISLFLASLAGALNSFATARVQKIMRYVPLKSVLAAALVFQNFEILVKVYKTNQPFIAANFFPVTVIAAYLFSSRLCALILKSTKAAAAAASNKTPTPKP